MRSALFLLVWLSATPAERLVVVNERESLAQVAERTLGDPKGASELRALNQLTSDAVAPGTKLKLPPEEDRARALSALETARSAVAQADRQATRREEASAKLREAEAHFQSADYQSAAKAADNAWALLSPGTGQPSSFQVKVSEGGDTTVSVQSGPPVRVNAESVTRPVSPGETVRVEKGQPPPPPAPPLEVPQLRSPSEGQKLKFTPIKGQLGPVTLAWRPVPGAKQYEVEVHPVQGPPLRQTVPATQWQLPALPAGRYRWTVRALGESQKSDASAERLFELIEDRVKLQVGEPSWK
ncbi:LysM peptidoglycan-binding domain-containing protein [Hyalangium rubrum]|uniref:LysM peptidoglycan-binding domain-containing protein n=1 Tax=Hyalangium rubrum TaxID=3103134 RepID=A0ABU5H5I8_9BACT|nr:LysM peptidoglycan-binding domain-containing protein [Hyalangium sp. s54d21]MDY7228758.1 LysM peptidoglycan-binding domain-containing protein [Hyalangium sp. s54d21]